LAAQLTKQHLATSHDLILTYLLETQAAPYHGEATIVGNDAATS
jgi:hypothetical protein